MDKHSGNRDDTSDIQAAEKHLPELARAFNALELGDFRLVIDIAKGVLRNDQQVPQAHYLIARVAIETRQLDIALKGLETAVELDASNSEYWAFLALVYSQIGNLLKAEKAVWKAQQIGSNKSYVLHPAAHVLSVLGHVKEAIENLEKATQISPDNSIYHRALGISLLEAGDLQGAQQSLNRAVSLNKNDAESWWTLSSLVKAKDNVMADQLISIMLETKTNPRELAFLGYAAGKLFEDTQSWEQAFAAFEHGAAAKRSLVNYNQAQAQKTFETIKAVCTKDWLQTSVNEFSDVAPIFIIGQPRTGTTLVDRIISSHSLVHSAGEPLQLAMSLRAISGTRTKEFISAELINQSKSIKGTELAESYLSGLANLRGTTPYFIDKFPMNFMLVGFILKAFPKAKIIHVTRGPADTCFAVFKQLFEEVYQHSYDQREMAEHYILYRNLMEYWHNIFPGKIFDVAYEDVVADNEGQARSLLQFLDLEWEDACIHFEENNTAVVTASAAQVREKAHNRSVGRWKHYEKQLSPTLEVLKSAGITP
ncbi:sulfotransferase [uncultured Paraglaciecola sp.]|uniref:tetratricopeptide repeat-containing sulfotransferase family protein n=1 Tax=uncultured Paraglaciecola sp. TaxID=1765024 RepID=UPI0030DA1C30|tara:strand:- start:21174 stop:22787 length:1614 start_codon:yes stop_codon:yes gene_type:complete